MGLRGAWRKLHNEVLYMCSSCGWERGELHTSVVRKFVTRGHLEGLGVGRIVNQMGCGAWIGLIWLKIGTRGGSYSAMNLWVP